MKKCACLTLLTTLLVTLGACSKTSEETTLDSEIPDSTVEDSTSGDTLPPVSDTDDPSEVLSYIESVGCNIDSWTGLRYSIEANQYGATMTQTTTVTTRKGNLIALQEYKDSYGTSEIIYYEAGVLYTNYNGKVTHKSDSSTTLDVFKALVIENYEYVIYLFDSYVDAQEDYLIDFSSVYLIEEDDLVKASIYGTQDYEYEDMYQGGYVELDANYRKDTTLDSIYFGYSSTIDYGFAYTESQTFSAEEYTDVIEIPDWLQ
ncbi:MAG: hypothetical protein LUD22_00110 [Coprobacillus sp.]|nr:hypothetical protein [Coprobacillus sp.]